LRIVFLVLLAALPLLVVAMPRVASAD